MFPCVPFEEVADSRVEHNVEVDFHRWELAHISRKVGHASSRGIIAVLDEGSDCLEALKEQEIGLEVHKLVEELGLLNDLSDHLLSIVKARGGLRNKIIDVCSIEELKKKLLETGIKLLL